MPGRKFSAGMGYRYGFNGKENDKDIAADDYDFGARVYDGRIGRWLSLDPLQKKYPAESPYMYVGDNPIIFNDPDGRDRIISYYAMDKQGNMILLGKRTYKDCYTISDCSISAL